MSSFCPNESHPDWKALVSSLGEANARVAFSLHNHYNKTVDGIPDPATARSILDNRTVLEKDEQHVNRSTAFKIQRAAENGQLMERMTYRTSGPRSLNSAQVETVNKMRLMNSRYVASLEMDSEKEAMGQLVDKTISVTKLVGSGDFKGNPEDYEDFARFGTFIHEVIEKVQIAVIDQNRPPMEILTREYFDNELDAYMKKKPFAIDRLDAQVMFDNLYKIAHHITTKYDAGFVVIPEVTVFGESYNGTRVVGRLDLVLVDVKGDVHIFDFKTKKVNGMVIKDNGNTFVDNNAAFEYLAMQKYATIQHGDYVTEYEQRTAYDNWFMQLQIYGNLLRQNHMNVGQKEIVAWLYEVENVKDADGNTRREYQGSMINVFSADNFYDFAAHIHKSNDFERNKLVGETTHGKEKIDALAKYVDQFVPYPGSESAQERSSEIVQENIPINDQQYQKFKSRVLSNLASQITQVRRQLRQLNGDTLSEGDQVLRDLHQNRLDTLINLKHIMEKQGDETDVFKSVNFNLILTSLKEDIIKNSKIADQIRGEITDGNPTTEQTRALHTAFKKSKEFAATLTVIEEIIDQFVKDENSGINRNSPIVIEKEILKDEIRNIDSVFRQVAMLNGLKILKIPGEVNFQRVNEQLREVIEGEIKILENDRQKLLDKKALTVGQALKSKFLTLVSKDYRKELEDKVQDDKPWLEEVKKIELEIARKKMIIEGGLSFSDEALMKYMNAVTDPESMIYIGAQDVFNGNSIMQGMMLDAGIASVSNSDLLISSMTQLLKNAEAEARINLMNGFIEMDFDKLREKVLKRFSVEQLNDKITEIRTEKVYNRETGETTEKQVLYFAKPYSEEYEQKFKEFEAVTRQLTFEKDKLKGEAALVARDMGVGSPEAIAARDAYLAKVKEKQDYEKAHLDWMLENASMEYQDDFYKLQQMMPAEIREEMNKLIHEKENLIYLLSTQHESEIYFTEEDLDNLYDIERRMKALRQKAAEENPEYKAYLEKSREYYTYDLNLELYQRAEATAKARYSGSENAEKLERWYKMNRVIRPNDAWYQKREDLYERRAALLTNDPAMSALIEERSRILRNYRINGALKLQLLTDEDAQQLEHIDATMEEHILTRSAAGNGRAELSADQIAELKSINQELMRIQTKRLTESYRETLNMGVKDVRNAIKKVKEAESAYEKALNTGADADTVNQLRTDLAAMEDHKMRVEKDFEKWFNKLHYDSYQPIETGFDPKSSKPKEWAYEKFPADSVRKEYTEAVPSQKYSIRSVNKDVIGNPDYLKSRDGIPMPKGVRKNQNGSYSVDPSAKTSNINAKYLELAGDPELMEFYNAMMKLSFSLQKKTTGEKIGYRVPGYAATSVENVAREGFAGSFEKNWKIFQDRVLKTHGSAQDAVSNEFGDQQLKDDIRNRFVNQLPLDIQTRDGVGALVKWAEEAHMNIAMSQAAPQTDMFIDYMKLLAEDIEKNFQSGTATVKDANGTERHVNMRKRFNELQNAIGIMEFERRKFIKGQSEIENSSFDRVAKKTINNIFTWTSFARIGFDLANQTKNMISGNIQAFLASGVHESAHYNKRDLGWAKMKIYNGPDSFFANYFRDWGNLSEVGYDTLLYRRVNPLQKDFGKYLKEVTGSRGRRLAGRMLNPVELSFAMQDKGDTEIGLTVMYAIMNHYQFKKIKKRNETTGEVEYELDKDGNPVRVPAHQAYVKTSEGFMLDPTVEYTAADETRLRNIIYSEVRRAQGNYAGSDKTKFEEGILGRLVFFYRKYLIPTFVNRFGYLRPNWESGDAALGYWRAMISIFRQAGVREGAKHLFLGGWTDLNTNKRFGENKVGVFMTERASHASRDMAVMAMLVVISNLILQYVKAYDDEDPEEVTFKEFALFNLFRIMWGVKGETTSMFPLGGGSQEYIRNFTTLTTYTRELNSLKNTSAHLFNQGLNLFVNGMDVPTEFASEFAKEVYKDSHYMRKQGAYEKGDSKLMKDLYDLTGMKNIRDLFNPMNRIEQMQKTQ